MFPSLDHIAPVDLDALKQLKKTLKQISSKIIQNTQNANTKLHDFARRFIELLKIKIDDAYDQIQFEETWMQFSDVCTCFGKYCVHNGSIYFKRVLDKYDSFMSRLYQN